MSANISTLVHEGRPKNQAIAIAMQKAGMTGTMTGRPKSRKQQIRHGKKKTTK